MARERAPGHASPWHSFLDFFSGNFSRQFLVRRLVPLIYLYLFACLVVANLLFPPAPGGGPGFIPFARTISGLGNRGDNPFGSWFFTAGLIVTSILMVPFEAYFYRQLSAIHVGGARFILFLLLAGDVGFAMVGIYDEESICILQNAAGNCIFLEHQVHDVASGLAFLPNLLAVLFAVFPMIADKWRTGQDRFGLKWQVMFIVIFIVLIVVGLIVHYGVEVPDFFKEYAFWEWSVFLGLVIYYISLALRLPGDTGKNEMPS